MKRLFGTDGIRGVVNRDLTGDLAYKVGLATAKIIHDGRFRVATNSPFANDLSTVIIGSDSRPSRSMIVSGLTCGLCAGGVNVMDAGILPTPAIAYLTKHYPYPSLGIMVTASHNPAHYNGIKIIGPDGYKIPDELEEEIEEMIFSMDENGTSNFHKSAEMGETANLQFSHHDYMEFLFSHFNFAKDNNLHVAIDCSNGSASTCTKIFYNLGIQADIFNGITENGTINGKKINERCGSTNLEFLQDIIRSNPKYSCGIAFDGDADRCLLIDDTGEIVDGDHIMAMAAKYLKSKDMLSNNMVVGTIMSNLGLIRFLEKNDIKYLSTKVGDKYVLEEMIANNSSLGGEQSGHIIFGDYATTGDGIFTALMVLQIMQERRLPLSVIKSEMEKYPQVASTLPADAKTKQAFLSNLVLKRTIADMTHDVLGTDGRCVVRPSGTEDYIRIMVEGKDLETIAKLCNEIKLEITIALGSD